MPRLHNVVELKSKIVQEYDFLKFDNSVSRRNNGTQRLVALFPSIDAISLRRLKTGLQAGIVPPIDADFTKFRSLEIPNSQRSG
jgi:hypothetical protein